MAQQRVFPPMIDFPCTECGANPGEPCRRRDGSESPGFHNPRNTASILASTLEDI